MANYNNRDCIFIMYTPEISEFPSFSLKRLLTTCFGSVGKDLNACILIDLPDLQLMHDLAFLDENSFQVQKYAKKYFLDPLLDGVANEVGYSCVDFLAFKTTGGSNLDPEDEVTDAHGNVLSFEDDVCPKYDIILAITDYSLTAPLTAMAKVHDFRGATLHGVNDIILGSGLAVDYTIISEQAEVFRNTLDKTDSFELNFQIEDSSFTLNIECKPHKKVTDFVLLANRILQTFLLAKFILFLKMPAVLFLSDIPTELWLKWW